MKEDPTPSAATRFDQVSLIWSGVVLALSIILLLGCASYFDTFSLRNHLGRWTVVALQLASFLIVVFVFVGWPSLISAWNELFGGIQRQQWLLLSSIVVAGLGVLVFLVPQTNRIFFDEHIYQNIAQTITHTGQAFMCNEGDAEYGEYHAFVREYNKQPNGFPVYLSLFFKVGGVSELVAHVANNVAYLIAVIATFFLALLLFSEVTTALFASAFLAFTPMVLIWADTTSAEVLAIALATVTAALAALNTRTTSPVLLLLMVPVATFASQVRPESGLIVPTVVLILLLGRRFTLRQREVQWGIVLVVILSLPLFLHLFAVRGEGWGSSGDLFGSQILWQNLPVNGLFFLSNIRYPLLWTILAIYGAIGTSKWRAKIPILFWFAWGWGVFLSFYAGSYDYGADVRFSLICAVPLAVLAGVGAARLSRTLAAWTRLSSGRAVSLVALALVCAWVSFLPLVRATGQEAVDARFDVEFAREFSRLVPPASIVLTHNPSMWLVWGKNAAQMSTASTNQNHVDNDFFARYGGGVYLHWNFWCNVPDPSQNSFCQNVLSRYRAELIQEQSARRFRYALYRLHLKGPDGE